MSTVDAGTKKILIIFIKTLGIYAILSVFFYCYEGLVDAQGRFYSPFLNHYSLIKFILNLLIYPLVWILNILGFQASFNGPSVWIGGSSVTVLAPCLGIQIMIGYVSLILGFPARKKIVFLCSGLLLIHLLNIGRMIAILLSIEKNPSVITIAHDVFTYLSYGAIIILYHIWVKKYDAPSS